MRLAVAIALTLALISPASANDWEKLRQDSMARLEAQQQALQAEYHLSKHERWDLDQDTGELVFSNQGKPTVVARFQFVGSVANTSKTWLWSWANRSIDRPLSIEMERVRDYGKQHGFKPLTEARWQADEADGWEMAAIANYLLKGKGVYRAPYDRGASFVVITEIAWTQSR